MHLLQHVTGADAVASCAIAVGNDDAYRVVGMTCLGSSRDADVAGGLDGGLALRGSVAHRRREDGVGGPIERPPRAWINRFVGLEGSADRAILERQEVWERLYGPMEMLDQTRVLVYSRGHFVRWVACLRTGGGARSRPFDRKSRAAAVASSTAVVRAFVKADALDRARLGDGGRHVVVLDSAGRVHMRSADIADWLRAPRRLAALAALIRSEPATPVPRTAWVHGFQIELLPLRGGDEHHWMLSVRLPESIRVSPLAALTPRQREIAQDLANGATLSEIAARLEVSVNTVKHHAKLIHRELDVASRTELVRVVTGLDEGAA